MTDNENAVLNTNGAASAKQNTSQTSAEVVIDRNEDDLDEIADKYIRYNMASKKEARRKQKSGKSGERRESKSAKNHHNRKSSSGNIRQLEPLNIHKCLKKLKKKI